VPKYTVTLEERVTYTVEVEADDEEQAREDALEQWAHSENPDNDFCGQGLGVSVDAVERNEEEA
jgi:hypothetical protein